MPERFTLSIICRCTTSLLLLAVLGLRAQVPAFQFTQTNTTPEKGYYLCSALPMRKATNAKPGTQLILDEQGRVVYHWSSAYGSDFKQHANGWFSYFYKDQFYLLDATLTCIDSVKCVNGILTDSHDFQILDNGNYLLIGTEEQQEDLSNQFLFLRTKQPGSRKARVRYGVVQELDSTKRLVNEWRAKPFFKLADAYSIYLMDTAHVDVTHFNSISVDNAGNYLISARYSNQLINVSRSTGAIRWHLGGKFNQFRFLGDSLPFLGQHDARCLPNGHITLFDNGYAGDRVKHNSRALEYELNEMQKTVRLVWSYTYPEPLISEALGNVQRLSNNRTLINYGRTQGLTPNVLFCMVDSSGMLQSQLLFADTMCSYRAFYYPAATLRLQRTSIRRSKKKGRVVLSVRSTTADCRWSTGQSGNQLVVTSPGVYCCYLRTTNGGWLASEFVEVTARQLR